MTEIAKASEISRIFGLSELDDFAALAIVFKDSAVCVNTKKYLYTFKKHVGIAINHATYVTGHVVTFKQKKFSPTDQSVEECRGGLSHIGQKRSKRRSYVFCSRASRQRKQMEIVTGQKNDTTDHELDQPSAGSDGR